MFSEKLLVASLVKKIASFKEPVISLLFSPESAT
jgi:hypothetical protein